MQKNIYQANREILTAPFPWFGGKRRVADMVWQRFGDVLNYVEPFAGSLAVLLGRPSAPRIETVNDRDAYLANFWRAVQVEPDAVARYADWPVNEADLHARHLWLVQQDDFRERMMIDPDYYDAKIAGWWVWGLSAWIGSGWCDVSLTAPGKKRPELHSRRNGMTRPNLRPGQGVQSRQIPYLKSSAQGVQSRQMPQVSGGPTRGVGSA